MTTEKLIFAKIMKNSPTSLYDFFIDFDFVSSVKKYNCVQTSILRYYLTATTGKRLKNNRLTQKDIEKQIQKLKNIEVDSNFDVDYHLNLVQKGGEMYGKTKIQIKSHVSYAKRFFSFVKNSICLSVKKQEQKKDVILSYRESIMDKSGFLPAKRNLNKKIILEKKPENYIAELREKYKNLSETELYEKANNSLEAIFIVLHSFKKYRINIEKSAVERTLDNNIGEILRFIGWYKTYKKITIDEVDIKEIIPVINPYIEYEENNLDSSLVHETTIQEISLKEWYLRRKIKIKTKAFKKIVNDFLTVYLVNVKCSTKQKYIQSLINFAKYLYRNVTDKEENDDYQDISLINKLRVCLRDTKKNILIEEEKIIPFNWNEIMMVFHRLKKEADQDHAYAKCRKNRKAEKLSKRYKALHLQDFLAIAFFCVMPPDRQRTFRELTFGGTLKCGLKNKSNGIFTSYENLGTNENFKYYIHLLPHEYKTGKKYGTYWYEINNFDFGDGTKFYDYLNKWFFEGYRDELATQCKSNDVFIRTETGISFNETLRGDSFFHEFIAKIFLRKTKYPLNPHALRSIYITDLNNRNVPEETRRSIAYMMHHDLETADKIYNRQTMNEKIALGVDFVNSSNLVSNGLTTIAS